MQIGDARVAIVDYTTECCLNMGHEARGTKGDEAIDEAGETRSTHMIPSNEHHMWTPQHPTKPPQQQLHTHTHIVLSEKSDVLIF